MLIVLAFGFALMLAALTCLLLWRQRRADRMSAAAVSSPSNQLYQVEVPAGMGKDPFVMEIVVALRLWLIGNWPANAAGYSAALVNLADLDDLFRTRLQRLPDAEAALTLKREMALDALIARSSLILTWRMTTNS